MHNVVNPMQTEFECCSVFTQAFFQIQMYAQWNTFKPQYSLISFFSFFLFFLTVFGLRWPLAPESCFISLQIMCSNISLRLKPTINSTYPIYRSPQNQVSLWPREAHQNSFCKIDSIVLSGWGLLFQLGVRQDKRNS